MASRWTNPKPARYLSQIVTNRDITSAKAQINARHPPGFKSLDGVSLRLGKNGIAELTINCMAPMAELSRAVVNDDLVLLFPCDLVAVVNLSPDGWHCSAAVAQVKPEDGHAVIVKRTAKAGQ